MSSTIQRYLDKRSACAAWPLLGASGSDGTHIVVVIPALAEYDTLFTTLKALAETDAAARTQVICVVNNREDMPDSAEAYVDNQRTLARLRDEAAAFSPLQVCRVDASSPGCALPMGQGVGLARKIGLDHGLRTLALSGRAENPLVCLDADSPPAPGYLDSLQAFYQSAPRWGGYAAYAHDGVEEPDGTSIIAYETYMRCHELNLRWAGSPYAFPALGSIISCTAAAYAAAGGMNRRCAGEDFYFMQQLVKTGTLHMVPGALVRPAGRRSQRTPFGTGQTLTASDQTGQSAHARLYHPDGYEILRRWLVLPVQHENASGGELVELSGEIHPELATFLEGCGFAGAWDKVRRCHTEPGRRLRQFHIWFDGLRSIRLIHHLRDHGFPNMPASEAAAILLERCNVMEQARARTMMPLQTLRLLRCACVRK